MQRDFDHCRDSIDHIVEKSSGAESKKLVNPGAI